MTAQAATQWWILFAIGLRPVLFLAGSWAAMAAWDWRDRVRDAVPTGPGLMLSSP
jgi:hypothetical protein